MRLKNKGFSLIELIIVVAIMAVLVGVMAPQYAKYLEKTKKSIDCNAISTILDACEVIALDPHTVWEITDPIEIEITATGTTYSGGAATTLSAFVPESSVFFESQNWATVTIEATKDANGRVTFDIEDDSQIAEINKYSSSIAKRLE
jgi:type IV pilus assembly protein PilA